MDVLPSAPLPCLLFTLTSVENLSHGFQRCLSSSLHFLPLMPCWDPRVKHALEAHSDHYFTVSLSPASCGWWCGLYLYFYLYLDGIKDKLCHYLQLLVIWFKRLDRLFVENNLFGTSSFHFALFAGTFYNCPFFRLRFNGQDIITFCHYITTMWSQHRNHKAPTTRRGRMNTCGLTT